MGSTLSAEELQDVPFLQQWAAPEASPQYDSPLFWSEGFASLSGVQLGLLPAEELETALYPMLQQIYLSNAVTRRYLQMLRGATAMVQAAVGGDVPVYFCSVVVLIRTAIKHLIETSQGYVEEQFFAAGEARAVLQAFLGAAVEFICRVDVRASTFVAHAELLALLLAMCSTQLYTEGPVPTTVSPRPNICGQDHDQVEGIELLYTSRHIFVEALISLPAAALQSLTFVLFNHYIDYCFAKDAPVDASYFHATLSVVLNSLSKQAATLALLPLYAMRAVFGGSSTAASPNTPRNQLITRPPPAGELVGRRSALLLLVLAFYRMRDPVPHPALLAVSSFRDSGESARALENEDCESAVQRLEPSVIATAMLHGLRPGSFLIDFETLYKAMVKSSGDEENPLFLYLLLLKNPDFLDFVVHREDVSLILQPILKALYHVETKDINTLYMRVIALLILSQHGSFNSIAHSATIASVPWYREKCLGNITLGSLTVLVLIRLVQYNLQHASRDSYLSTNCLAALANMAPFFNQLHVYASQRLVFLIGLLARRLLKVRTPRSTSSHSGASEDADICTEFLRITLQCINACITATLPTNLCLVYELIHQKPPLDALKVYPGLAGFVHNIQKVLLYFEGQITTALSTDPQPDTTSDWVLQIIAQSLKGWRGSSLKVFNELKFQYEEEADPEEFFCPYIWDLVLLNLNKHPAHRWNPRALPLLSKLAFSLAAGASSADPATLSDCSRRPSGFSCEQCVAAGCTVQVAGPDAV